MTSINIPASPSGHPESKFANQISSLDEARNMFRAMGASCRKVVKGRDDIIAMVLTAMFADGHVLLEDHPGSGKTTMAKAIGNLITPSRDGLSSFRRIQFTPDLLPSDVTGVTMFEPESREFRFHPGPVFANVVLGDEINRTSPKVQAALLEAMAEKQVTIDNHTHALDELFFVLATQNPLDLAGTYPLPRAQLDRFLFKICMKHLPREAELNVLLDRQQSRNAASEFRVSVEEILHARRFILDEVYVAKPICECLTDFAEATRNDPRIALGVSTRSLVIAIPALQVWAMLNGRDHVTPSDIKSLAVPLFSHRIELHAGSLPAQDLVSELAAQVVERHTQRSLRK